MGLRRKIKKQSTPSKKDRQSGEEKEVTPKRRESEIEDPEEGCSQQVSKAEPAIQLPKKDSFLHRLRNQWERFAGYIKRKRVYILKKGRQLWGLDLNKTTTGLQSPTAASRNKSGSCKRQTTEENQGAPTKRPKVETATKISKESNVVFDEGKTTDQRHGGRKRPFTDSGSNIKINEQHPEPRKKAKLDIESYPKERTEKGEKVTVPLTVDKFTFYHVLGEGGFGMVMLATDSIRKERVAVKAVKKRSLLWYTVGLAESKFLQMAHESIFLVHGYGAFQTTSYVYYVMELVTGGTLCDLIEEREWLSLCTITFLVAEIVCGIQFLHSKGIIHRDLKADNILLTTQGHIKITDFGLAIRFTREEDFHGSPALETITGEPYFAAEDWFALGLIITGLVTSLRPIKTDMAQNCQTSEEFDPETIDLLRGLFCEDKSLRLGVRGNIREHAFFSSIKWEELESGKAVSPIKRNKDAMNEYVTRQISVPLSEAKEQTKILMENQELFKNVSFVCPTWSAHYHSAPICPSIT
ncbi:protein kinase C delta type-like [Rhinoderma darwinii]|uniref:protein kinase C delta type-like n=1 Tax=Rhinoderma darwinii TaxID=43563 RepID=UPI003F6719B6